MGILWNTNGTGPLRSATWVDSLFHNDSLHSMVGTSPMFLIIRANTVLTLSQLILGLLQVPEFPQFKEIHQCPFFVAIDPVHLHASECWINAATSMPHMYGGTWPWERHMRSAKRTISACLPCQAHYARRARVRSIRAAGRFWGGLIGVVALSSLYRRFVVAFPGLWIAGISAIYRKYVDDI